MAAEELLPVAEGKEHSSGYATVSVSDECGEEEPAALRGRPELARGRVGRPGRRRPQGSASGTDRLLRAVVA